MNKHNLVKMANNIGSYFQSEPDRKAAVLGIRQHIQNFWDPRMRNAIVQYVREGGTDLSELVHDAVNQLIEN